MAKDKDHMNLVIIGHIDNGKSTMMGHLLIATGAVSDREAREMEKMAKDLDRESWKFAYFLDRLAEERKRGITIDLAFRKFETKSKYFTIIDAPGHQDFVKNMITGASQADAAILVFSAKTSEFAAAISDNGQGREHAFLARTLGVKKIILAINKMDDASVNYGEGRYNEVKDEVEKLLKIVGYNTEADVIFLPVSAFVGDNLAVKSENMKWYTGPTLVEALNDLPVPSKPTDKALRLPVQDVYKIKGSGVVPVGRIETGMMKVGMKVAVAPTGFEGELRSIEMHHEAMQEAGPGDNVGYNIRGITMKDVYRGCVVADAAKPCTVVTPKGSISTHVIVIWHPTAVAVGYCPVVHSHTAQIACKFMELTKKMDPKTGQVTEDNPQFLKKGDTAVVKLQPIKKFPLERYKDFPELGRVAVRDMGRTVSVGVVLDLTE
ncbi:translation elongation factor EF-1 subunit alpha [Promethearchaeum syntrophicum]|uniref:Elongation factor 1-alpha n=1 Tax=Promethearchaeum syntrophicum TaxID=2594042 RepID=A0A5B9D5R3_9ARCH|nr:translation elongation factor EF-1 subunit alpha [Candidatus Prometheoarchaeum syntrophicum]QEE14281.1 Elongation factor 1-alpha [Candidatus Prometheoarchaeum syntrophicum]